jgi:hypothetical protein
MLENTAILQKNPDVIGKRTDDEVVLVMPKEGQVKVLNEVAALIWELTNGKRNIGQIVDEINIQFEVDLENAELDTKKFIKELVDLNILFLVNR